MIQTVALALLLSVATLPPATPVTSPEPPDDPGFAEEVLEAHNRERKIAKLPPLKLSKKLEEAAKVHTDDMVKNAFFSHEGSDKSTPFDRIKRTSYEYRTAAENIARGQIDVPSVMKSWMESIHHRENILGDYTEMGVAITEDESGQKFWCVDFGTPWPVLDQAEAKKEVVELINKEREAASVKPLVLQPKLSDAADGEAEFMASGQSLEGDAAKKFDVFAKIKESGLKYKDIAQTAAVGLGSPADLVKYLIDQPDYKKALLDDFKDAGIGYAKDAKGNPYWCIVLGRTLKK